MAEAVRCYAPHSFSVQTSKERLTLAKHVHAVGQLVSRSRPFLGQLVHVNFLAQRYWRSPAGVPTPLDKVNVAGQYDREVQSFMANSQSYDTICVT